MSTARRKVRRGLITLELLLNLPIWLIVLFAGVQFGQMVVSLQQVAFASRVGADAAAQHAALPNGGAVPADIVTLINDHLESAGLGAACEVNLEHNVHDPDNLDNIVMLTSGSCPNGAPPTTTMETGWESVRVTVCVPLSSLTPNLLGNWCVFDMSTRIASQSTTFRYEL